MGGLTPQFIPKSDMTMYYILLTVLAAACAVACYALAEIGRAHV